MSYKYLGENFDIHGGGMDLVFPHHSNEIAQSCSAFAGSHYAKYWVHNGFLTVSGEKMSKSLGNFVTVRNLRDLNVKGEVIRYVLLSTHYRKPLDWNEDILHEAKTAMDSFYRVLTHVDNASPDCPAEALNCLLDDLNSHALLTRLHALTKQINKSSLNEEKKQLALQLKKSANLLGLLEHTAQEWFGELQDAQVLAKIAERTYAKSQKNWQLADKIREELRVEGIELEDNSDGTTSIIPL
jgi:cysteinyl-tRNA synthetase